MPNPFYRGERCGAREMEEIYRGRYNEVRAAGWSFDHGAGVWRHAHTGRTGLNQHVIYECLRNHDAMPPCGDTRASTSREDLAQWVVRATRLREIEANTGRLAPQYGQPPRDAVRYNRPTRQPSGRPQMGISKDWQPNAWEA
jgi:hypothetical protein